MEEGPQPVSLVVDLVSARDLSNVPRIYHPHGFFEDEHDRRFDLVFTELLRDPTLPPEMFWLPQDQIGRAYWRNRRLRESILEWNDPDTDDE